MMNLRPISKYVTNSIVCVISYPIRKSPIRLELPIGAVDFGKQPVTLGLLFEDTLMVQLVIIPCRLCS